jgi:hypothetical protein
MVDTSLTADGTVNLCQQSGWDLNELHTPHKSSSNKPRNVTGDTSTKSGNHRSSIGSLRNQIGVNVLNGMKVFTLLTIWYENLDHLIARVGQALLNPGAVQPEDCGVRYQKNPLPDVILVKQLRRSFQQAGVDVDVVAP